MNKKNIRSFKNKWETTHICFKAAILHTTTQLFPKPLRRNTHAGYIALKYIIQHLTIGTHTHSLVSCRVHFARPLNYTHNQCHLGTHTHTA